MRGFDAGMQAARPIGKSIKALALMAFCAVSWVAGAGLAAAPVAASTCIPFGGTCSPDDFSGQANGTLVGSSDDPFLSSAFDGTYATAVYEESGGSFDFYYQVTLASDSTDGITEIDAFGFQNALADMGYRSDGSSLGGSLVSGSVVPTSVTRGTSGDEVAWDVVGLNPGDTSTVLEIHTNATAFTNGAVEITNGGNTVEEFGYAPVVTPISSSANPTSAQVGATLQDSATLSAAKTLDGSGSITWDLYAPGDTACAGSPVYTETVTDTTTDGPYSTTTGYVATAPGTYNWVASFSGDLGNPPGSTYCGEEPVVVTQPTLVPQITSASTTCSQFATGTASTLSRAFYSVAHAKINAVTPSGFTYWIPVTSTGGTQTYRVTQFTDETSRPFRLGSGSSIHTTGCSPVSALITQSGEVVTVRFNGGTSGTEYLIGLKFSTSGVVGEAHPAPSTTVRYLFKAPGASRELDLVK
jgi:hypothetical protein